MTTPVPMEDPSQRPLNIEDSFSHILIIAERGEQALTPMTLQVIGKARDLADQLGVYVYGLVIGTEGAAFAPKLVACGVDHVILSEEMMSSSYDTVLYAGALSRVIEKIRPEILLFGSSSMSADLAPRVAQRWRTGLVSGCIGLDLDTEQRLLVCTRTYYGGRLAAEMVCPIGRPQMAILKEGVFSEAYPDPFREGTVEAYS